ncbi:hypothetical protein BGI52_31100 [Burkholderia pseudomallei]|nr:hypothetical protein BGI49_30975 [Burkholderia pseudomallei]APZ16897.1 hypothetical protein BGI52_31100 [Burkholderia pseudomallei]
MAAQLSRLTLFASAHDISSSGPLLAAARALPPRRAQPAVGARRGVGPPARPFPWNRAIEQPTIFMKM